MCLQWFYLDTKKVILPKWPMKYKWKLMSSNSSQIILQHDKRETFWHLFQILTAHILISADVPVGYWGTTIQYYQISLLFCSVLKFMTLFRKFVHLEVTYSTKFCVEKYLVWPLNQSLVWLLSFISTCILFPQKNYLPLNSTMSTKDGQPTIENSLSLPEQSQNLRSGLSLLSLWSSIGCFCSNVVRSLVKVSI